MEIANPIYDVAFKYLMEDSKVAKLLISSIIGEDIEELSFKPQEFTRNIPFDNLTYRSNVGCLTVYRVDFSATIKTPEGLKQVIIEVQKAKEPTDIMRFRSYLGDQYSHPENSQIIDIKGKDVRIGLPIISIYFLGHRLEHTNASIISVKRKCMDVVTNEEITEKESFVESLTHDSYIIQIPCLAEKRRTELEILLSIFDQSNSIDARHHVLLVREEDFPEKYREIIRRLQMAILQPETRDTMELEDTLLIEFQDRERQIIREKKRADEAEKQVEQERQMREEADKKATEADKKATEADKKAEAERLLRESLEEELLEMRRQMQLMKK